MSGRLTSNLDERLSPDARKFLAFDRRSTIHNRGIFNAPPDGHAKGRAVNIGALSQQTWTIRTDKKAISLPFMSDQ